MNNGDNPITDIEDTPKGKTIIQYLRFAIYFAGLIAAIVSFVISTYGNDQLAQLISVIAGFLSSTFGLAYNPINGIGAKK